MKWFHTGAQLRKTAKERDLRDSVSVVMPVFNHQAYVGEAIASVLDDDFHVRQLIVVDDGSTDDSLAIVRAAAARDPRLTFWSQPNNGAHAALNAGMSRATGRYVAILNSDDVYRPGRLKALCSHMQDHADMWVATSGTGFIDDQGSAVRNEWYVEACRFADSCSDLGTALLNANFLVSTSNYIIRRDLLDRIGPFAPLRYAHDLDLAIRVLALGGHIGRVNDDLLGYRVHASNTINEDHFAVRREWSMVAGVYLAACSRHVAVDSPWSRLSGLLLVLDRHKILQGAALCASYFRCKGSLTIAQSGMLSDPDLLDALSKVV